MFDVFVFRFYLLRSTRPPGFRGHGLESRRGILYHATGRAPLRGVARGLPGPVLLPANPGQESEQPGAIRSRWGQSGPASRSVGRTASRLPHQELKW